MRIYQCADYKAMSRQAANLVSAQVIMKPDCVLGLATGATPVGVYAQLVEWVRKKDLSFSRVTTVNLDEYRGLPAEHEQSYRYFMNAHLFDLVDVRRERTHVPNGLCADPAEECARYDRLIDDLGGIDLQVLGLGRNGHIGFNEPGDSFILETHLVDLSESTIRANARFFAAERDVPRQAITMGMRHIMQAKKVVVVANGPEKADAVARSFTGPVTPRVPASILQLHPDVVLIGDACALSGLQGKREATVL